MGRRSLGAAAAVVLAVGALTACSSGGGVSVTAPPTPTASSGDGAAGSASPSAASPTATATTRFGDGLAVGDCLDFILDKWDKHGCDKAHMYEVSAIVTDSRYPHDQARRGQLRNNVCDRAAVRYLGGPIAVTNFRAMPLPAADDTRAADRIVCLSFGLTLDGTKAGLGMKRMKGWLADPAHLEKTRTCWERKGANGTSCVGNHIGEAVSIVWLGGPGAAPIEPGAATAAIARDRCAKPVREYLGGVTRKDLVPKLATTEDSSWRAGHTYGICYVSVVDGSVGRSVKDIKHAPLKDYR